MITIDQVKHQVTKEFLNTHPFMNDDVFYYVEKKGVLRYCNHTTSGFSSTNLNEELAIVTQDFNNVVAERQLSYCRGEHALLLVEGRLGICYLANSKGSLIREVPVEAIGILNLPYVVQTVYQPRWWGIVETKGGYEIKASFKQTDGYGKDHNGISKVPPISLEMSECVNTYSSQEEAELFLTVLMSAFNKGRQSVINQITEVIS